MFEIIKQITTIVVNFGVFPPRPCGSPPGVPWAAPKASALGGGRPPATPQVGGPGTGAGARGEPRPAAWRAHIWPLARHLNEQSSNRRSRRPGGAGRGGTSPRGKVFARAIRRYTCGGQRMKSDRAADAFGTSKHAVSSRCLQGTAPRACCRQPRDPVAEDIVGDMTAGPAPHSRSLPEVDGSPRAAIRCNDTVTR